MEGWLILIGGLILYFLPSFVGGNSKYAAGIFILNLFLGWTLLGWVGALVWAVSAPPEPKNSQVPRPPVPHVPSELDHY